jgi:dephospho-CoA kinase
MLIVGLTGGIGAGKSLVAQNFSELGATVVDADQLARIAVAKGSAGFDEVVARFGDAVLKNGDLNRQALAEIVFSDSNARTDLEAITHPKIRALFKKAVADLAPEEIMVYEIPLLVETKAGENFDFIVTVEAPLEIRKERLLERGMQPAEIDKRIAAQAPEEGRIAIANAVIRNDGDEDHLLRSVENLWEDLERRSK